MNRIALVCSEPLRPRMAGIGIRFAEFARQLSTAGFEIVLVSPANPAETQALDLPVVDIRSAQQGVDGLLEDCHAAVAQGYIADTLVSQCPDLPIAIDLYDPWLIENIQYYPILGPDLFRGDHASWVLQLSQGDLFLCSSPEQRQFYLGFLTMLARVHPVRLRNDPDLRQLIVEVPFGVPSELPPHRPFLTTHNSDERRLLFGALYDWYDPWPVLEALATLDRPNWKLLFIGSPNPRTTPQEQLRRVKEWCGQQGVDWWGDRVQVIDAVPPERRYDLTRDVDLLISTHLPSLETDLSLRTRFLDALAVGCPVVATQGGAMSRLLAERSAGWVVAPGSADAVSSALSEILEPSEYEGLERRCNNGQQLAAEFDWNRIVQPLIEFCQAPRRDPIKGNFAVVPMSIRSTAQATPAALNQKPANIRSSLNKVTVAVASWNGLEHLKICLPALATQEHPGVDWEVLVLDNGSSDGTADWVAEHHPEVRLLRSEKNLGFSLANNRLVEVADGDAIALLNNDTQPQPEWLGELVQALGSAPGDVAAVAGLVVDWEGKQLDFAQSAMRFDGHAFQIGEGRNLQDLNLPASGSELFAGCGASMLIDRQAFLEAGGFDPAYYAYFEDVDLGWRLWSGGRKIRFTREAIVHHRGQATGNRLKQAHRWFLYQRNALMTVYKNYESAFLERMMAPIWLSALWHIKTVLVDGEPNASFLATDPYLSLVADGGLTEETIKEWAENGNGSSVARTLEQLQAQASKQKVSDRRNPELTLSDDASLAVLSALSNFLTHLDQINAQRKRVQKARKRSDFGIFERFPPLLVPYNSYDQELFQSDLFLSLLPDDVRILKVASREQVVDLQSTSAHQQVSDPTVAQVTIR